MSRRKQSNPKPLLKSDCQEGVDEMTVERDNKDFCDSNDEMNETSHDNDNSEQFSSDSIRDNGSPISPRSSTSNVTAVELTMTNRTQSPIIVAKTPPSPLPPPTTLVTTIKTEFPNNNTVTVGTVGGVTTPSTLVNTTVPKLRLNVSLASDPALKPNAKDIKIIQDDDDDEDIIDNGCDDEDTTMISSSSQSHPSSNEIVVTSSSFNKKSIINTTIDIENESSLLNSVGSSNTTNNCNTIIAGQIAKPLSIDVAAHRLKVFMCHPCGIGFSSHSTLEAHQKYYCSHRQEIDDDMSSNNVLAATSATTNADKSSSSTTGEPLAKSIKTGKQYACTQCSYSADKKVSLNRHMRMHQSSPTPSSNTSNGEESSSQQIDRYCSECDIRFSNVKTYRAHKQHYCSSRRTEGQTPPKVDSKKSGSVSPQGRSKTPTTVAPPQPFLALPTNPILIIPYSVVRTASLLPGPLTSVTSGVANPDTTCFTFENGALHPVATALNAQILTDSSSTSIGGIQSTQCNTVTPLLSEKNSRNSNNIIKPSSKKEGSSRETVPLDLSIRKSPLSFQRSSLDMMAASIGLSSSSEENRLDIEAMMEGKENLSIVGGSVMGGKLTPEQIVCSPSLPSSPSMSPSPKRKTTSPRTISAISSSTSPLGSNCLESPVSSVINTNIRPLLPADLSLKFAEATNTTIPSLLSKHHIELALKLVNKPPNESTASNSSSALLNMPPGNSISVVSSISNVQPQIYVKQGVSKCKECNIVFCKYENYLAHKQHYCSARNQEDTEMKVNTPPSGSSASSTSGGGGGGNIIEPGGAATAGVVAPSGPVAAYHQLICAACGIKYTSLDNLRAHQTFYCPKGGELNPSNAIVGGATGSSSGSISSSSSGNSTTNIGTAQISVGKEKCNKCKIIHDINKQCPISTTTITALSSTSSTQGSSYKCPVCGVVSLSAADNRKHLETHGSVKAFRCSICQYKGNTLRGMRTHIRMHFDKKSSDFNEEHYMSCILEEEGIELPSQAAQTASAKNIKKNNVARHTKLNTGTPPMSPEVKEVNEISTQNGDKNKVNFRECVTIKEEPVEIHSISSKIKIEPEDHRDIDMNTLSSSSSASAITAFSPPPVPLSSSIPLLLSSSIPTAIAPIQTLSIAEDSLDQNSTSNIIQKSSVNSNGSNGQHQQQQQDNSNSKYCRNCDIKFNYVNTYIAHKQFYCKSNKQQQQQRGEIKTPPSPIHTSPITALDSSNKNKENVEKIL